ncbi:FkbM family methyltransferase [Cesiribacter sp. SM1]|uniref:FkbM family methyltransferase n=1 Tax=Cesiribacter sp. SM1 TaxID=2861196 RepID=UPI001CD521BC|nr:FkbM family methyltransferase [Cesiribacter sp. SM1]
MIINTLKRSIRKLILGYDISTYYFSQGGEDAILQALFHKKLSRKDKGFFIDVGAYHPYKHSNTYFFYINGWRGINIDARPGSMKSFNKVRPKDVNLEVGVSEENGTLTYYFISESSTMNSFSKDNLLENGMYKHVQAEIPVKVTTLEDILDKHAQQSGHIDLLSVDAEGLDYQVLRSNNWSKYKPDVIVLELSCQDIDDVKHNISARFLFDLGYRIVAKNVIIKNVASVFFVSDSFDY